MANDPERMETLSQAINRLRGDGYDQDWYAEGGRIRCGTCSTLYEPSSVTVDHIVRFEGSSDPGDEAILFALTHDCDHRGLYSVSYGPSTPPDDVAVIQGLPSNSTGPA